MSIVPPISRLRRFLRFGVPTLYTLVWMGVTLLVLCMLASAVLHLQHTYSTVRAEKLRLEHQVQQAQVSHDHLAARKKYLESPEGQIVIATEHGMVRPGDVPVYFTQDKPAPAPAPTASSAEDATMGGLVLAAFALFVLAFFTGIGLLIYRWWALRKQRPAGVLTPRSELKRRPAHSR